MASGTTLETYRRKRDFRKTPEPKGGKRRAAGGNLFVVQKHHASRLHYDFRLQVDGVLASWAVPKGPSLNPADKRLAVHVEDHPLDYGSFEGVIPKGEYGGGTVLLWDHGTWTSEDGDPARAIRKGKISFTLDGEKLHGGWTLTRLHGRRERDDDHDNWLLIKRKDDCAETDGDALLEKRPESVKSGRSLEEIAEEEEPTSFVRSTDGGGRNGASRGARSTAKKTPSIRKRRPAGRRTKTSTSSARIAIPDPAAVPGARESGMPRVVSPQLCTLVDDAPEGDEWIHEIKFDGYRIVARRTARSVSLLSRNQHDWTSRLKPIANAIVALPVDTIILDGEAVILDRHGHSSFQLLQNAIKARQFNQLAYFAFDLLYLNGYDLREAPLLERKRLLEALFTGGAVEGGGRHGMLRYSDHVVGGGPGVRSNACELALEGIISKRADAPYSQRRSKTWLKVKCSRRQEFVVIGWWPSSRSRLQIGSLLLGAYDGDGKLIYTGRVGTGFDTRQRKELRRRLASTERQSSPTDEPVPTADARGVHWVTPQLVAEVEFTEWTDDGRLRHPSFQGLREDKKATSVQFERRQPVEEATSAAQEEVEAEVEEEMSTEEGGTRTRRRLQSQRSRGRSATTPARKKGTSVRTRSEVSSRGRRSGGASRRAASNSDENIVAGVRISSGDRVLYPDVGVTKLDVARYYERIGDHILPFVANRPLSTVRCPQGSGKACFFQKHPQDTFTDPIKSVPVKEKSGTADYIMVDSVEGLVTLVQFGVLEIHPWGSTADDLEHPDLLTFDLDPGPGVALDDLKQAAVDVANALIERGLRPFLKVSGGKGLHVVAPLKRGPEWDEVKAFCAEISRQLAGANPKRYTAVMSKAKRTGKVFIDYLRNGRGATAIAPFSTRARPGATVAVPLRWEELAALERPDAFSIEDVIRRVSRQKKDPWEGFHARRASDRV